MIDQKIKCECGRWYTFYSMYVGFQGICPKCQMDPDKNGDLDRGDIGTSTSYSCARG